MVAGFSQTLYLSSFPNGASFPFGCQLFNKLN